ncbi:MAG: sodium ion-translocating decarboxylase subunit beta, partial [Candidatus Izemoplasmatales bacterium]
MWQTFIDFLESTGIAQFFAEGGWKYLIMIVLALGMMYLAIFKGFEPYLLIPIAMGMLLVNLPGSDLFIKTVDPVTQEISYSGLLGFLYFGVESEIYPCLIFVGIGATTDFGPLIANPKSMLLGAAA